MRPITVTYPQALAAITVRIPDQFLSEPGDGLPDEDGSNLLDEDLTNLPDE